MSKRKTHEEFIKEVEIEGDGEYEVLGEYLGNGIKIKLRHKKCNHEYEVVPYSFLNGRRCPKCRSLKKDPNDYKQDFNKKADGRFELLSEYINARTKIKVKHLECSLIFETLPNNFLNKMNCPECYVYERKYNKKKTTDEIKKEVKLINNGEYIIIGGIYNGKDSIMEFQHLKCGTKFKTRYHDFKRGRTGCPKRGSEILRQTHLKSNDEFIEDFEKISENEYTLLSEYSGSDKTIKVRHNKCESIFYPTANNFLCGSGCPVCNESKGENAIANILKKYDINFLREYKFEDCKVKRPLPFDFYLPDYNMLIEYDGEQHYMPVNFDGCSDEEAKLNFKKQQKRDEIKNKYCKRESIKLLRIPYWDFDDVENILLKNIN